MALCTHGQVPQQRGGGQQRARRGGQQQQAAARVPPPRHGVLRAARARQRVRQQHHARDARVRRVLVAAGTRTRQILICVELYRVEV